ncbi:hypothetical protein KSP35_05235 [Aquihabitans sp. G128]|uniref:hypothetical protein n=1 Tax=Aquihabitans sp. G128 TaxID=2849779 RepID=UPI001C23578D|nr:hypothetical protein [Aquihabitans sp. G128]QXC62215.1 hypothetical protein KSP35_05235 [Aquihabitans sp. G128]
MVRAERTGHGLRLTGSKGFCTGAGIVDAALVTVPASDGPLLLLVDLADLGEDQVSLDDWRTPALADTRTATVTFDGLVVGEDAVLGGPGWYLDRPGFWLGAVGPAACWAGAAQGLVDHAADHLGDDPHRLAHLGALTAASWDLDAILSAAGDAADRGGHDVDGARRLALTVRHLVDDRCEDVQRRFERALGPRALAGDAAVAERHAALTLYRRQCHAEADLEALGRIARARPAS